MKAIDAPHLDPGINGDHFLCWLLRHAVIRRGAGLLQNCAIEFVGTVGLGWVLNRSFAAVMSNCRFVSFAKQSAFVVKFTVFWKCVLIYCTSAGNKCTFGQTTVFFLLVPLVLVRLSADNCGVTFCTLLHSKFESLLLDLVVKGEWLLNVILTHT